jgi:heterodisulfide reductase subunit A
VSVCPYNAIERISEEKDKKTVIQAKVNEGLCQGCGTCVSACPSHAIQQRGFQDKQLRPMIEELLG